jgi:predicted ATPase
MDTPPWYVLTGGPSAGKTTLLKELERRGHRTISEAARAVIEEEASAGRPYADIRSDEAAFQHKVLLRKIDIEKTLPRDIPVFFDRGIPDSDAYYRRIGIQRDPLLESVLPDVVYRKAFLLELIPFKADEIRKETPDDARKLNVLLRESYERLGIPVIDIPLMPVQKRADFVLAHL